MAYNRERWSSQVHFNSSLASNSGANLTTRNQTDLNTLRLLRWNNWFYAGTASFLQSSVQEINLQTTLGAGVGRYLKNTNRASIYVLGGLGWQNAGYGQNIVDQGSQNTAVGLVATQIKALQIQKDEFGRLGLSPAGDHRTRTCPFQYKRGLLHQDRQRSLLELFVLRKLGHSPSGNILEERLRHQFRTQLDLWQQMTRILAPRLLC